MANRMTVVALPFVSKQGFCGETTKSLVFTLSAGGFDNCRFFFIQDNTQVGARNAACKAAIDVGAEWLLFIDSDADFPIDTLSRLKRCDADIACADMWSRNLPSFRTVMRLRPSEEEGKLETYPVPDSPSGVEDVDLCGMHCTLIRVSLLKEMAEKYQGQPWFWATADHGEDTVFCLRAMELKAKVRCDFSIMSGHWGVARMAGQDWSRDAANQPMPVYNVEMLRRMDVKNLPGEQ